MQRHRSFRRRASAVPTQPNLNQLSGVVSDKILHAMCVAAEQLHHIGVRAGLAGGLAVGAYGYPRATKDVDFLVGSEGFAHHLGGIVSFVKGVPIEVGDVRVDPMSIIDEPFLDDALSKCKHIAFESVKIPVLPIEALIYLKLKSPRHRDGVDVVELIRNGIDVDKIAKWLQKNAPDFRQKFSGLVLEAEVDED